MSFTDMEIDISYISYGEENIAKSLITPALKTAKYYKRSVGFFSSSVIELILDGVMSFAKKGKQIQLITSVNLSEDDINAINQGYKKREEVILDYYNSSFEEELSKLDSSNLQLLYQLIAIGKLDIKIALTKGNGMYHDKFGILEDHDGNIIVFYGSANSSKHGYKDNYEKIRVVKSWDQVSQDAINDEMVEFDKLWSQTHPFVDVMPFSESVQKKALKIIERNKSNSKKQRNVVKLRDYQEEAVSAWKNNKYKGFFVMATGTGKTWTAIFCIDELLKEHEAMVVITAPYKHLVKQWSEDVVKMMPNAQIILVSSENPHWETEISESIIRQNLEHDKQIIIITTLSSFNLDKFQKVVHKSKQDKLLIVDEAHRFTNRSDDLLNDYKYMLGLSATPFNGKDAAKGNELMRFFGGSVYNLPIEVALEKKFLVPYNYYPIFVTATEDEESVFNSYSAKIAGCFKNGVLIDKDNLVRYLRARLRIISMAEQKQTEISRILSNVSEKNNLIVYCGDGKCFNSKDQEVRHIQFVKQHLNDIGYKSSQFTANENMKERMELVNAFINGDITALAAIKCLDEGINIPCIEGALILSSNDDFREFTQRRGRILRKFGNKKSANIYDVIVLPSSNCPKMAELELRRFYEYAKLAINKDEQLSKLNDLLVEFEMSIEDILFKFEEEITDDIEE